MWTLVDWLVEQKFKFSVNSQVKDMFPVYFAVLKVTVLMSRRPELHD